MKKYNLQRLKALSGAVLLTATLTSCSKKEETQSLDIQIPNTAIDKFISSFEENREQALDCINEAREQQKEEVVIDLDEIREQIKASTYYSEEVKKFIEEFFAAGVVPDPSAFSEVAAGDIDYLHYLIIAGNTSAPLSYEIGILNTQVYKASEIQFFDNQRGLIPDLPNIIIPCMESNNYGNYIVYASNDFFIVAKNNGTIVAHTKDGFKEVYDYRYSLISLNDLLKRYGLDEFIKCEYSEIDLKNLRMILSKKIMGYKNRDTINVSNMLVIDTKDKYDYPRISTAEAYYFLDYVCEDAFSSNTIYRDLFHPSALVYVDKTYMEFSYEDFSLNDGLVPFNFNTYDFKEGSQVLFTLPQVLEEKGLSDLIPGKTISFNALYDIAYNLNTNGINRN